jgi:hypothetical protein
VRITSGKSPRCHWVVVESRSSVLNVDLAALQEIIKAPDAIPAISVSLKQQVV